VSAVAAAILAGIVIAIAAIQPNANEGADPASSPSAPPSTGVEPSSHSYLDIVTGERTPAEVNLSGANLPEVSPNGESVVYFSFDSDEMFVAPIDGSDGAAITLDGLTGVAPTWIDDETILFQGRPTDGGPNDIGDLYAVDTSTGDVTMVTDLPLEKHGAWFIVSDVSPDGTTVLFHLPHEKREGWGYDLWTAPMAGGEATLLRKDAGFAQYGPDGSIVFFERPVSFEGDAIWIMDGDGRGARSLVEGGPFTSPPRFSPDGATVSYAKDEFLEIVDIASGDVTELDASTHASDPAWYDDHTLIID
jgi:Tol biopolymer transport system component